MIALIDYGMGNLHSVAKALARVGGEVQLVNTPAALGNARAAVLPGVGALGDCMTNLRRLELEQPIREFMQSGRPFLGICLGLQGMFDSSEEAPGIRGLSVFAGTVPRFQCNDLKVPHMGWNRLIIRQPACPLLKDVAPGSFVYFVHSYYCQPQDPKLICGTTEYGIEFCSMLWRDNIYATQFHPEKSQAVGLAMLRNFVNLAN